MANTNSALFGSTKSLSRTDALGIGHENVTFSFWVKMTNEISSGTQGLMNIRTNAGSNFVDWIIQYDYNGGTRRLIFNRSKPGVTDVQMFGSATLGTANWHHIYFKYDTATMRGGMDGAELVNQATSGVGSGGASSTRFGSDSSVSIDGKMDDVRVYDANLSDATVWGFYTSPAELVGNEANLRAYYTFNSDLTTDLTANAYTLTNNNTVTQSTDVPFTGTQNLTMSAGVGAFTLTGNDANIGYLYTLVADVGSYVLTGIDILFSVFGFTPQSRNNMTPTNQTRNNMTPTNQSRNNTSFTNQSRH